MNGASWSSYQSAAELPDREEEDRSSRRWVPRCDGCGKFISTATGSGSRFDFTPDHAFGPEKSEWLCKACAGATPLPPTAEQIKEWEREEIESYARVLAAEADAEAASRVGKCDYCGNATANPKAVGGICKSCDESLYADVPPYDTDSIPW